MDGREYFYFLLKIKSYRGSRGETGELWVCHGVANTVFYDSIEFTEEMKAMNGRIIECYPQAIDDTSNRWIFNRLRTESNHPGVLKSTKGDA